MYKLNSEKMFYDVAEGMGVVIDFTTGCLYNFNELGTAIFDRINVGGDTDNILEMIKKTSGCPEDIEETYQEFINTLIEKQILIETPGDCSDVETFTERDFAESKKPVVEEFNDVQDLILADPIHDVDPNTGWPALK